MWSEKPRMFGGQPPTTLTRLRSPGFQQCQGLAELNGDEGVSQFVRNIHAEPRQATALLTSMLRLALPDTCDRLVEKLMSHEA